MDARVRTARVRVGESTASPVDACERGRVEVPRVWRIDEATAGDAEVIASCIGALADELVAAKGEGPLVLEHGATAERTACDLRSRFYRAFIARQDGAVIGAITLRTGGGDAAGERYGWIQECFVAPDWRGCGVGSDLVSRARAAASEVGCGRLDVTCPPLAGFAGTRRFYEREGFRASGVRTLALSL